MQNHEFAKHLMREHNTIYSNQVIILMVKVIGLKGLAEARTDPAQHTLSGSTYQDFWSVVGVGPSTKSPRKSRNRLMARVERKAMRNISYFEKIPERGQLL